VPKGYGGPWWVLQLGVVLATLTGYGLAGYVQARRWPGLGVAAAD
jgi:hypothetical protein